MNRLLSSVLVACAVTGSAAVAQPVQPASSPTPSTAVARFLVDVDGLEVDYPGEGGGLLPRLHRLKNDAAVVGEAVETLRNPEGSVVKSMMDSVYTVVAQSLGSDFGLRVLPVDTLRDAVPYVVGYPMGTAATVARAHAFDRVAEVGIDVTVPDAGQAHWSVLGSGTAKVTGKPEMVASLRLVDATGTTVWKERVRVRSKEKVTLTERYLLGFRTEQDRPDASSLPALTQQAMDKLAQRYRERA